MRNGAKKYRQDFRGAKYPMVDTGLHYCLTPHCHGTVNKKKAHSPFCIKCKQARWKEKNPLKYSFGNLRRRAKQRGHEFSLTFEQYVEFSVKTGYARLKGKTSLSLSIDRKKNDRGYHADNIQAITLAENSRKQYVPFFAKQFPPANYRPQEHELAQ